MNDGIMPNETHQLDMAPEAAVQEAAADLEAELRQYVWPRKSSDNDPQSAACRMRVALEQAVSLVDKYETEMADAAVRNNTLAKLVLRVSYEAKLLTEENARLRRQLAQFRVAG